MFPNQKNFNMNQMQMNPMQMQMQMQIMQNMMMMNQQQFPQQMNQQNMNNKQNQSRLYKTTICRHFSKGNCSLGNNCHFAHGQEELRQQNDPLPSLLPQIQKQKVNNNNFKTQQCKYFQNGSCKNGANCSYAHGNEVRSYGEDSNESQQSSSLDVPKLYHYYTQNFPMIDDSQAIAIHWLISQLNNIFFGSQNHKQTLQQASNLILEGFQANQQDIFNSIISIIQDPNTSEDQKAKYQQVYSQANSIEQQIKQLYNK